MIGNILPPAIVGAIHEYNVHHATMDVVETNHYLDDGRHA